MTTYVFPGQGSQFVGMSRDFYENFKVARNIFEEISDYTKIDLKNIIFEDKENKLNITNFTQVAIFTASVSIFKTIKSEKDLQLSEIDTMLGHSLGEYSALACSEKVNLKDCSLILKKRGELMNNAVTANETGMAALIGLNAEQIKKIIYENKINLEIANDNSPMQIVVSGDLKHLEESREIFIKNNVKKFVRLNVSAAFHSKYMINAQTILSEEIDKLNFNHNTVNIISNHSSLASNNNIEIKNSLKKQMASTVRWTESIKTLIELGEKNIVEIGPNKVLSGLINRISKNFNIKSITEVTEI